MDSAIILCIDLVYVMIPLYQVTLIGKSINRKPKSNIIWEFNFKEKHKISLREPPPLCPNPPSNGPGVLRPPWASHLGIITRYIVWSMYALIITYKDGRVDSEYDKVRFLDLFSDFLHGIDQSIWDQTINTKLTLTIQQ